MNGVNVFILYRNSLLNMFDEVQDVYGVYSTYEGAMDEAMKPIHRWNGKQDKWPGFSIESEEVRA